MNIDRFEWAVHKNKIYHIDYESETSLTYLKESVIDTSTHEILYTKNIIQDFYDLGDINFNNEFTQISFVNSDSLLVYDIPENKFKYKWDVSELNTPSRPIFGESSIYIHNVVSVTDVETEENYMNRFSSNAYPNPFNPNITIEYELPYKEKVILEIFNVVGEKIDVLINEVKNKGMHKSIFKAKNLSSGIYYYKLTAGNNMISKKIVLIK